MMRSSTLKNKTISFLLVIALLLQGCVVYKKAPVTLDEALVSSKKILIIKTDGTKLKLRNIEKMDSIYYGYLRTKGKIVKIPLTESDLKTIRLKDPTLSTIGNALIVMGTLGLVLAVVFAIALSNWDSSWGDWSNLQTF